MHAGLNDSLVIVAALFALGWFLLRVKREDRAGTQAIDPSPPVEAPFLLPETDAWETDYLLGTEGEIPVQIDARIRYVDGRGQESNREIRTRTLCPWNDDMAIFAFCKARRENRTFIVSRIKDFVDLRTGEVIQDIVEHLRNIYFESARGQLATVFKRREDELAALVFVARADGRTMTHNKRDIIVHYLIVAEPGLCIDSPDLQDELRGFATSPSRFRAALKASKSLAPDRRSALIGAMEAIARLRKKPDEFTIAALEMARKQLIV